MYHLISVAGMCSIVATWALIILAHPAEAQTTPPAPSPIPAIASKPPFWAEHGAFVYRVSTPPAGLQRGH